MDAKQTFLSAKGSISRTEFWLGTMLLVAAQIVVAVALPSAVWLNLLLVVPQIFLYIKRLRDRSLSGWCIVALPSPLVVWVIVETWFLPSLDKTERKKANLTLITVGGLFSVLLLLATLAMYFV